MSLGQVVSDIADACVKIDTSGLPFKSFRTGVGPYGEPQLVRLLVDHLNDLPDYAGRAKTKRTPDLLLTDLWALEFKIARPFGDNGLEAEDWSVNLLHPYPGNVSVYGDCLKLAEWEGPERRAAVVIGFEHEPAIISLDPLFRAFEAIAARLLPIEISPRCEMIRRGLVHPVHQVLRVAAWEVPSRAANAP
ncbi:MAG TPA: hypothetical protein VGW37_09715 [Terriglobia bacterium]|nr:hypothetical protein [Terriglobia bacterium]